MEAASIAIWEKDLVAVGIAISIWGFNSAFLIQGKALSDIQTTWQSDRVSGVYRVNKPF
jgi:hypothetical protein